MVDAVDYGAWLTSTERDAASLAEAATRAGIGASVPTCPEWRVLDLLAHIGRVQAWARLNVARGEPGTRTRFRELPEPPDGDGVVAWFKAQAAALIEELRAAGPETPVWTWAPPPEARFWARRIAHETAIHRLDAELAAGRQPRPFPSAAAMDGVDEVLANMPYRPSGAIPRGSGESLHFHAIDGEGEWLARLERDGPVVTREHAKGDVGVRGTASTLFRLLWGRADPEEVEVFGDEELLARFRADSTV